MKKNFISDIENINENIKEVEKMLKESMNFYEDDAVEEPEMEDEMEPEIEDELPIEEPEIEEPMEKSIDSYVDHIRKYALNGLSALCDNPESEEYQMLKKIFQMCDKKPEKKEGMSESKRLFGVLKENKEVLFEIEVKKTDDFKKMKSSIVSEAISYGYNPSDIKLVSENKIVK